MQAGLSHDVFICHASEDKADFVRPLAEALEKAALRVWYDEFSLQLGDSLRRCIDRGLNSSSFGIVVLSKAFFAKSWPQYELDGLVQREMGGSKVILPIWHGVTHDEVARYSSSLADRMAANSTEPMDRIVARITEVVHGDLRRSGAPEAARSDAHSLDSAGAFDAELQAFCNAPQPVSFDKIPYWYVRVHGGDYNAERIASLSACHDLIRRVAVRLRGWSFPHLSSDYREVGQGNSWVSSWNTYRGVEWWRLYQSGQFVHLRGVREHTDPEWREKLARTARVQLRYVQDLNPDEIPGCVDIVNCVYTVTEVYEFAARMCREGIYVGSVLVSVELRRVRGFALMADVARDWSDYCPAGEDTLGRSWTYESGLLATENTEQALHVLVWLFERFGWLDVPIAGLQGIQGELTARQRRRSN